MRVDSYRAAIPFGSGVSHRVPVVLSVFTTAPKYASRLLWGYRCDALAGSISDMPADSRPPTMYADR